MSKTDTTLITAVPGPDVVPFSTEPPGSIALEPIPNESEPTASNTAADGEAEAAVQPTGRVAFSLILVSVSLVLMLGGLDANIVSTAVPSITDHFHTVADVGWYYTAYRLSSGSLQFAFGKLYTLFSTKKLFILTAVIFVSGSTLCAAATSSPMFVVGRAITGVGVAGGGAGFFKLLVDVVPLPKRPILGAVFGIMEGVTGLIAPLIGGLIVENLSWRWCFWINLPIGGAAILALIFLLPETNHERANLGWKEALRQMDIIGTLVLVPGLASLFIALNWGGVTYSWSDGRIIALFVVFGLLLTAFVVDQVVKGDAAILPVRILKDRNIYAGALFSLCVAATVSVEEYYAPTYFQAVLGYSPARSGYMMLPTLIGFIVAVAIQGFGTSRIGYLNPFMITSSIITPIAAGLLTTWSPTTSLAELISYFALAGFGAGIGLMTPQISIQTSLSKDDIPLGTAVILFAQNFGPALFVAIAQTIFTNTLSASLEELVPGSSASYIESLGIREIKYAFSGDKLQHVIQGYSDAISNTWYLAVGLTCLSGVGTALTKWKSVKEKES